MLSLAVGLSGAPCFADWTDVTTVALADTGMTLEKKGAAFVDFDVDGQLDICGVGEGGRAVTLLRNDGGVFTNVTAGDLLFGQSGSGQTWGDYDADGDPDLFLSIEEAAQHLFRNDGGSVFTDVTIGPLGDPAHGHTPVWLDYDLDGDLDLYVANLNQPSRLFRNDAGVFTDATADSLGVASGNGVAVGDYDNDGDPDLYLVRFSLKPNLLLRNDGGSFVDVTTPLLSDPVNGNSGSWADYDNDGDLDLYVVNANASNRLFRNDGLAGFVDATTPETAFGAHSRCSTWSDFDNDGRIDLYVTVFEGGPNRLLLNQGGGTFLDATTPALVGTGMSSAVCTGDYDEDGDLDLYMSSYSTYPDRIPLPNKLIRNDLANGNHWLQIDLEGTFSNRSAIGARVTLKAGGVTQIRELTGSTGTRAQNAPTVHFGLGSASQVTSLRVRWPSGIVQDTSVSGVDQRILIVEHLGPAAAPSGEMAQGGPRPSLRAPAPSPARGAARIAYELPRAMPVTLSVLDIQGRLVRTLERGTRGAGPHLAMWDGIDASGARARPAMYLCVLSTPEGRDAKRLVLVR